MPPTPPGRDTSILLLVLFAGLAVMAFAPPTGAGAPPAAAGAVRAGVRNAAGRSGTASPPAGTGATTDHPGQATTAGGGAPTTAAAGSQDGGTTSSGSTTTSGGAKRIRLMDTRYARYSYLISNETLTNDARRALDGFRWNRTRVNASTVRITLIPEEPQYKRYSVLVRDDQKLYFIETSFGDDAPHRETQLDDDAPVKVDGDGYVVQ